MLTVRLGRRLTLYLYSAKGKGLIGLQDCSFRRFNWAKFYPEINIEQNGMVEKPTILQSDMPPQCAPKRKGIHLYAP